VSGPRPGWELLAERDGVRLLARGSGEDLVVIPGLEGDGTSCLHVVEPVAAELARRRPLRLVLVDYSAEQHPSLAALTATVLGLVGQTLQRPAVVWGQSFGCLLAAAVARTTQPGRLVLVSPFTRLPTSRDIAASLLPRIPRPLYRATAAPTGRWVFGPTSRGEGAAFLASLRDADPADVARRAGWLRGHDHRDDFAGVTAEQCTVWFGVRDRLIDLRGQLEVFAGLLAGDRSPGLVPHAGHVVLPVASVAFLQARLTTWLTG
jgi:hypothetical protein